MTKQELISSVASQTGISQEATRLVIETTTETIIDAVSHEETVFLRGFGSFLPKHAKAKLARNISAGTTIVIPARTMPAFKPYREFKERVNEAANKQ